MNDIEYLSMDSSLWEVFTDFIPKESILSNGMVPANIQAFLNQIEQLYRPNPYHNKLHAKEVMVASQKLWSICGRRYFEKTNNSSFYNILLLLAAAAHDTDHAGQSADVHEVHHANLSIEIMETEECNFLPEQNAENFKTIFYQIILRTDMNLHGKCLKEFASLMCVGSKETSISTPVAVCFLSMLLKSADVWHVVLPWGHHTQWTMKFMKESDYGVDSDAIKDQIWFLEVICRPTFNLLTTHFEQMKVYEKSLNENIVIWRDKIHCLSCRGKAPRDWVSIIHSDTVMG